VLFWHKLASIGKPDVNYLRADDVSGISEMRHQAIACERFGAVERAKALCRYVG
jgi:hypothetical protein